MCDPYEKTAIVVSLSFIITSCSPLAVAPEAFPPIVMLNMPVPEALIFEVFPAKLSSESATPSPSESGGGVGIWTENDTDFDCVLPAESAA